DDLKDRVGRAKGDHDEGEIRIRPSEVALQKRGEDAECLAVDVVDRRRGEQQCRNPPAEWDCSDSARDWSHLVEEEPQRIPAADGSTIAFRGERQQLLAARLLLS